jgi:succinyl-diaminopimelate desuccinylase
MYWYEKAQARKEELVAELQQLIQIESVLDEENATEDAPFGKGPKQALDFMLAKGEQANMVTKNVDNMAGHIEMGQGEDILGILCHVDVVPAGDASTWSVPPFEGRIVDGKIVARGSIDDKGPTMAAWMAMKLVQAEGIELNKRVRMIIGTDEESGFRCVKRYFEKEEMPAIGFAPDADFPLINAEKGIADIVFAQKTKRGSDDQLVAFKAGRRTNMVPDQAVATIQHVDDTVTGAFEQFLATEKVSGAIEQQGATYVLTVNGKSAHAMEPHKGKNAAVSLAKFLAKQLNASAGKNFAEFMTTLFDGDHYGQALQFNYNDEMSGPTTLNPGVVSFDENGGTIRVSMRYSVTYPFEEKLTVVQQNLASTDFTLDIAGNSKPHYVPEEDELVATLLEIYRGYTGDMQKPLSTGGGTYARVMKKGVAFGMLFPGEPELAHQADEFVDIENLVKATAIYAEAIVKLASK